MKVLIIIPAYNEEKSLKRVIDHLKQCCPQYDYVIVNDGSSDRTKEICEENRYQVIHHPVNMGLAEAMRTGMVYALEHGYDMVLQFDADGQHLPEYIEDMVTLMDETGCDIVIASRYKGAKMPFRMRTLGSKMITAAIRLTTGKSLTDPTSGMRALGRKVIENFDRSMNFYAEPDAVTYLIRKGYEVKEVQVEMKERETGVSYFHNPFKSLYFMLAEVLSIIFVQ